MSAGASLAPDTDPARRIQSLDIRRGMALLGMFVVHFHMRSTEPAGLDDLVRTLIQRLVERVPAPLARFDVERDDAVAKEIGARPNAILLSAHRDAAARFVLDYPAQNRQRLIECWGRPLIDA